MSDLQGTVLGMHRTKDDPEPVLTLDDMELPGDAMVTVRASMIADLAYNASLATARAIATSNRRMKTVIRDDAGKIIALYDEPTY